MTTPLLQTLTPDLSGRDGWTPMEGALGFVPPPRSFVSSRPDGDCIRIRYFINADGQMRAPFWLGSEAEGPPGHAHGGILAAILDEALGFLAWHAGLSVVLARLTTHNRRMVPLRTVLCVEANIAKIDGRKVIVEGRIVDDAGRVYVDSDCLFVTIDLDRFKSGSQAAPAAGPR
jgi:acyl-coenzyme A thioesterase PaaI-like protein